MGAGAVLALVLAGPVGTAGVVQADDTVDAASQGTPPRRSWEWWNDPEIQKELGLSAEKVGRINDIYTRRNADLRPVVHEYLRESAVLDKMTRERVADDATYQLQVMRVEAARARVNESRMVMLYRMYRELTPEQHGRLQDIFDRRFDRGRGRPAPPK